LQELWRIDEASLQLADTQYLNDEIVRQASIPCFGYVLLLLSSVRHFLERRLPHPSLAITNRPYKQLVCQIQEFYVYLAEYLSFAARTTRTIESQ
jgi:hypothetical protein